MPSTMEPGLPPQCAQHLDQLPDPHSETNMSAVKVARRGGECHLGAALHEPVLRVPHTAMHTALALLAASRGGAAAGGWLLLFNSLPRGWLLLFNNLHTTIHVSTPRPCDASMSCVDPGVTAPA
jgi:hypothetical protein